MNALNISLAIIVFGTLVGVFSAGFLGLSTAAWLFIHGIHWAESAHSSTKHRAYLLDNDLPESRWIDGEKN